MKGIVLLAILVSLLFAAWYLMRKIASLGTRWRRVVAAILACPLGVAAIQLASGYRLAPPHGPLTVLVSACVSYVLLIFLFGSTNRNVMIAGLGVPLFLAGMSLVEFVVVLAMLLNNMFTKPIRQARISPTVSYRIMRYPSVWGGATLPYTYEIYKNPSWLPSVWKKVIQATVPCGDGNDIRNLKITPSRDGRDAEVSCPQPKEEKP
jgi:hypothetical protein